MHEKFTLIDDKFLVNTSANFSWGARTNIRKISFFTKREWSQTINEIRQALKRFKVEFEIMWNTARHSYTR